MRINFHGQVVDEPVIRAGFIGCGSHAFRNVYPTFQFAPVNLVATCDLDIHRAQAFARKFGAQSAYTSHIEMLQKEQLDAVFIVTGYDAAGRPQYPQLAADCLAAGCHVWIEKPPAASIAEIDRMDQAAQDAGKHVLVGLKKMFFPANEKAKELMDADSFGQPTLALLRYPQYIPTMEQFAEYAAGTPSDRAVISFLDHLCHPVSLLLFLLGMPRSLYYERACSGAGVATFTYESGTVATLALTHGACGDGGMEQTFLLGDGGPHIVVENNSRVYLRRSNAKGYGNAPSYFTGDANETSAVWEPEFSLGQLYNKGLFLLGYYGEVNEFARSILDHRAPAKGTLEQARQATRIFEAFFEGPGKVIALHGKE